MISLLAYNCVIVYKYEYKYKYKYKYVCIPL